MKKYKKQILRKGFIGFANHDALHSNIKKWRTFFTSSSFYSHLNTPSISIISEDNGFTDLYITDSWGIIKNSEDDPDTSERILNAKHKNIPVIAFFGGSTLKGVGCGSPEFTIPSIVEKEFKAIYGTELVCVNHGVAGWYCAEQFHYLLHHMPYEPDYVVFYDGWNCFWNLYNGYLTNTNGKITWKKGTSLRHLEYDLLHSKMFDVGFLSKRASIVGMNKLLDKIAHLVKSNLWLKFWNSLAIKYFPIKRINPIAGLHNNALFETARDEIMNLVAAEYIRIHSLTKTICESRKVKFIHYLQPILETTTRELNDKEKMLLTIGVKMGNPEIFALFPDFIKKVGWPIELVDLSKAFNDTVEDIFVNDGHLNKMGNAHVAKKIITDLHLKLKSN